MRRAIGGLLSIEALDQLHGRGDRQPRPLDRDAVRAAAIELRQRGLLPADIADALRLSPRAVLDLLGESNA